MERGHEETQTQESSRRGSWQIGWTGAQRGQTAGKSRKWAQGRLNHSRKKKIAAQRNARRPRPGRRKKSLKP